MGANPLIRHIKAEGVPDMNPEQLRDLVRYRLEQAPVEALTEAARDAGAFRGAINRAYYAMFYALLGLPATRQLGASKHSGAIALFDREFVRTGISRRSFPEPCTWPSNAGRCTTRARSCTPISTLRTRASRKPSGSSPPWGLPGPADLNGMPQAPEQGPSPKRCPEQSR